ncbi:bifunctional serine/threonine-protein kinase/formylglycine-generating enzyme family protein [Planktothrix agardhii 1806]|uniref:bifunctional serine/threonine-protein kinase/formylglycine-generating enzyme family protein n=1 Tax=Planktothrix agardhii TaxID=1160 RepID=UPI001F21739E|nr:bifunctional serine/threonine-protein kinase/formylglycine-generating enzyme family protein [Planktothrix agardhii]MCF3571727.1 bifunctional serine/threonine-protein kinase/formylglycine-generating enzyme family protein [Planktothrix agardhii 1805]MCF3585379.1 bifunctional serine/threonine-protein kinase/formylglycine-generating enzyme family protein [Planktothrix agardhii 1803]MCF3602058.1 bifunctional serine/threonine-protein kinase/formylglycine-generating enzyme family protein [Planktothr
MAWQPGTKLYGDRYTIIKELGQGGCGITFLGRNRKGKDIVIKTLLDKILTDPNFVEFRDKYLRDFEKEATRLAVCRHPHIVQIDNVFREGFLPCIAMEYIAGQNLWELVRGKGALPEAEAIRYIQQIGHALTVVHDKGLLHRDIKPHNIMKRDGKTEAVLIDFGIAREFIPNITQTHTFAATHGFAPLEQYDEHAHRGEYTDVYALSATLYFLLTGKVPTPAPNRIARFKFPPLNQVVNVSNRVYEAVMKGLELRPEDRPQSVLEWLEILVHPDPFKTVSFETVTVNSTGKITNRRQAQAQILSENINGIILDLAVIPAGTFLMGSPSSELERSDDEGPQHTVNIASFLIGQYAVTQAQWRAVAGLPKRQIDLNSDPSDFKGDNLPVDSVNWFEAVEFCDRLSQFTGRTHRLPSEAEWEYACRAGTTTPFYFGETITTDLVNYDGNYTYGSGPKGIYREKTTAVGSFPPNAFGLYDMHGNLWEWCADPGHENYNSAPTDGSVWESGGHTQYRVFRGGSWVSNPWDCRSADRIGDGPGSRYCCFGFRVVSSPLAWTP